MNPARPFAGVGANLAFGIAQHLFPACGEHRLAGLDIPVPHTGAGTFDGKVPALRIDGDGFQQAVERVHQLTHFVLAGDRQGLHRLVTARAGCQRAGAGQQGCQLAAHDVPGAPPDQAATQQNRDRIDPQHAVSHGLNRGKGFRRRQAGAQYPARGCCNVLGRRHHLDTPGVEVHLRPFKALCKAVQRHADTGGRERGHDAGLVGAGYIEAARRIGQHVLVSLAVGAAHNRVQEIVLTQVDNAHYRANHLTLRSANGCRDGDHRCLETFAQHRLPDRGFATLQRSHHVVTFDDVESDPVCGDGRIGNHRAIGTGNENATVEELQQHRALSQAFLQRRRVRQQSRADFCSHGFKRLQAVCQLSTHLCCQHGGGRELLCAQVMLQTFAQQVVRDGTRYRSDEHEDHQSGQRDAGFE